jgi:hypothetical protein
MVFACSPIGSTKVFCLADDVGLRRFNYTDAGARRASQCSPRVSVPIISCPRLAFSVGSRSSQRFGRVNM